MPVIAGQSAGLLNQRVMPNYHDQCVFSLSRSVFDLVAAAPLNSFGNHHMRTQKPKELRLTFIQEKKLKSIFKSLSNEPSRCLDFGKTTGRVTDDLELDGDDTSKSLSRKRGANERKRKPNVA